MRLPRPIRPPVSTYRLQFHGGFRFGAGRDVAPYLHRLGITDCYSSPALKAHPGSTHGYDICDHTQLNPEFGGELEYGEFCDALRAHDLGHIVDIVPNHMACDSGTNPWWRDVLENGQSSPFADFFDIEWNPIKPELRGKVLLPVLGDQYGRVLERGELRLAYEQGALHLCYFELNLPINSRQSPRVLELNGDRLEEAVADAPTFREYQSVLTALRNLPGDGPQDPARVAERQRDAVAVRERLARLVERSEPIAAHVADCVRLVNGTPGDPHSFDLLHELLEQQAYRLAYWRTAFDEVNYRRFFDINDLVGLRMEEPRVFEATHTVLRRLVSQGSVTGIRVDHPDGLFDPQTYFENLQHLAHAALPSRAGADTRAGRLYVVAEKILSPRETLPPDWPVDGTTGYNFLNLVSGLFVDGRGVNPLRRIYSRLTGHQETFAEVAYRSKRTIMLTGLASELNVLAHALNRTTESDRRFRDFTLDSCRKALREVIACFPVYRTYVSERGVSAFDREAVETAVAEARRRNPVMQASVFGFVRLMLLPPDDGADATDAAGELDVTRRRRFAMKAQQLTSPVQAKGVEDTAFYRYHVLVSANDVGGHPGHLGVTVAEFHDANRARLAEWPLEMLATATHDTKRGEDARARLAAISEVPDEWRKKVSEWMRANGRHRSKVEGGWAPDRNDEYLMYQALLGTWPPETDRDPVATQAPDDLVARLDEYVQKAIREAKVHTSWIDENQAYANAAARFVQQTLAGKGAARFLSTFVPFARRVARLGLCNSLSQLVLKLASPGVPDFFQGSELWDWSLVDPDNRRPVNFEAREQLLAELSPALDGLDAGQDATDTVRELLAGWTDGRIKLFITACGLRMRRRHRELFLQGDYLPLEARGSASDHLVAFARRRAGDVLVVVAPRLTSTLARDERGLPLGLAAWGSTELGLPDGCPSGRYRHLLTGESVEAARDHGVGVLHAAEIFRTCPVALLWHAGGARGDRPPG